MDAAIWDDGQCACGGEYQLFDVARGKNGGNYYYYTCDTCGKTIETHTQQTKANKTREVAALVDDFNPETGCSTLVDWDGEEWLYEGELEAGQQVIIKFDDMGTADIYDDEILEIIYKRG